MATPDQHPRLVIWGASSHALVVADIVRAEGRYEIAGFLDDVDPSRAGEPFAGATVLGGADRLDDLRADGVTHVILGFWGSPAARADASDRALAAGFELATAIHPSSVISPTVTIGPGTVVHEMVFVEAETVIGTNAIINGGAALGHEIVVEDGAHVGGRSTLAGLVRVEAGALIEVNVVVGRAVTIGARSVIGSMSLVLKDVPPDVVAYGIPARVVREA